MLRIWTVATAICLATAFAASAPASGAPYVPAWMKIFEVGDFIGYIDTKSKRDGPIQQDHPVTNEMEALVNFRTLQIVDGKSVVSLAARVRFDCVRHQTIWIDNTFYDSNMGSGARLDAIGINHTFYDSSMGSGIVEMTRYNDWASPRLGSFEEALWNAVCAAPRKPGQSDDEVALATARNNADIGNSCGEPEINDPAIVSALNAKVGQFGGPPQRIVAIHGAAPQPGDKSNRHTRCHGTLVFAGGKTEVGLLLRDQINGVSSWRWHSDEELAQGANSPAQKKVAAQVDEDMRRSAERTPNAMVGCGVEGPQTVYATWAVCYAVIKFVKDNQNKLKPDAGYALLQDCGRINSKTCLGIVAELQSLGGSARLNSKMALTEQCANDLEKRFPGNEQPQYMNSCQDLVGYFN
jgi:hypothetical protein